MTWPLTRDEVKELRQRLARCTSCGTPLPNYPETRDGRAHQCLPCLWYWRHGAWPAGWKDSA